MQLTKATIMNITFGKVGNVLFKLLTLVMLAAAGVWVAALIVSQWYRLEVSGTFVKWRSLDGPQNFQKIVHVHDFELRAQADDGKVYSYTTEWKEWQPDPGYVDTGSNDIRSDCEDLYSFHGMMSRYPPPASGVPMQCGVYERRHPIAGSVDMAYYVLLDNGTIWMWRHTRDVQGEFVIFLAGLFIGLIVGIILWLTIQKWL